MSAASDRPIVREKDRRLFLRYLATQPFYAVEELREKETWDLALLAWLLLWHRDHRTGELVN